MSKDSIMNVGMVGVGRRTTYFPIIEKSGLARVAAVCDINKESMDAVTDGKKDILKFTDYEEMIEKGNLDVVIISTPIDLHAPQSALALEHNVNVFCEVAAAVSEQQCRDLVAAGKKSKARYMFGENCNYMKPNLVIREMVKAGVFGELYYAEGEYDHDCKDLAETTKWRRKLLYGINGITYGTHPLGPILSWMEGDRIVKVSCVGGGNHYSDAGNVPFEQQDTCVMLGRTLKNRLIKIRQDLESNRTYSLKLMIQGTNGCFETGRCKAEQPKYWVKDRCKEDDEDWLEVEKNQDKYIPDVWKKYTDNEESAEHGGSDCVIMRDFLDCIANGKKLSIGIQEGIEMTLPCIISQESIKKDGAWIDVPNSREW